MMSIKIDRKGAGKSGIRLSDQRGLYVSVKGIKICKYIDILSLMPKFEILAEGDSPSHYIITIDGDFDLVTNRNSLSRRAFDQLSDQNFVAEMQKFLEALYAKDKIFSELVSRLRRESSDLLLNEQMNILTRSKERLAQRERFRITDGDGNKHLFLSPLPGEEYLVGVLFAVLGEMVDASSEFKKFWKKIVTFSTQGIDSLALRDLSMNSPLSDKNIAAVEYKYEFHNSGPFNHALAVVDCIVAWDINIDESRRVKDNFTCFEEISKSDKNDFEWVIDQIEDTQGGEYPGKVQVLNLKGLIEASFEGVRFTAPGA